MAAISTMLKISTAANAVAVPIPDLDDAILVRAKR
jgi:hypothetical protein